FYDLSKEGVPGCLFRFLLFSSLCRRLLVLSIFGAVVCWCHYIVVYGISAFAGFWYVVAMLSLWHFIRSSGVLCVVAYSSL
ncbi:8895_t:CDS:2, partial [Gigaspora rosea]